MKFSSSSKARSCFFACLFIIGQFATLLPAQAIYEGTVSTHISTSPTQVRLAGVDVFNIPSAAGGFSAQERSLIVERNIDNALVESSNHTPDAVQIITINGLPVIRIGNKHVVTIDHMSAKIMGTSMNSLADLWADSLRRALSDNVRISTYLQELNGSFISTLPFSQNRRPRLEAARLNRSADSMLTLLPPDLQSSQSFERLGAQNLLDRKYAEAADNFRHALALDTGNTLAHYGLALTLLKQGQANTAISELQMARWQEPDNALVHIALGEAFETQGHDVAAIKQFQEASLLQPENPEPYLLIADLREERNDISKSVAELTTGIHNSPSSDFLKLRRKDQVSWRLIRQY